MAFKDTLINECVKILKREDVKKELKSIFTPFISLLLQEIYPYVFVTLVLVILVFILILGIFVILLRSKTKLL